MDINRIVLSGIISSVHCEKSSNSLFKGFYFCLKSENSQIKGCSLQKYSYYDICVLKDKHNQYKCSFIDQIVKGRRVLVLGELKSINRTDALGNIYTTNFVMADSVTAQG
ncbi:MAG: hypothetical protein ACI4ND_04825 [Succinivibrio sp.]